jgi:hypothetical protein
MFWKWSSGFLYCIADIQIQSFTTCSVHHSVASGGTELATTSFNFHLTLNNHCCCSIQASLNSYTCLKYRRVCKQITILILYQVSSGMATFCKCIYASVQVINTLGITTWLQLSNFVFQVFPRPHEYVLISHLTLFWLLTFICLSFSDHWNLAFPVWSDHGEHVYTSTCTDDRHTLEYMETSV